MLPYDTRPHRWDATGRCSLCAMRSSWEGARYSCTGVDSKPEKKKAKQRRTYDPVENAMRCQRRRERLGDEAMRAEWRERARASRERRKAAQS